MVLNHQLQVFEATAQGHRKRPNGFKWLSTPRPSLYPCDSCCLRADSPTTKLPHRSSFSTPARAVRGRVSPTTSRDTTSSRDVARLPDSSETHQSPTANRPRNSNNVAFGPPLRDSYHRPQRGSHGTYTATDPHAAAARTAMVGGKGGVGAETEAEGRRKKSVGRCIVRENQALTPKSQESRTGADIARRKAVGGKVDTTRGDPVSPSPFITHLCCI